jgi:sugar/nucleoside kinase (ribokinase family)
LTRQYEILAIGNAITDILGHVPECFITELALEKGAMRLVDSKASEMLLGAMDGASTTPLQMSAGGSAANTAACIGLLGGRAAYIGKVADDALGVFFRESMEAAGVDFYCSTPHNGVPTATCLAAVTPDGERTMSTYLGACRELGPDDVDEMLVQNADLVFLEGYLLDSPSSKKALLKACRAARSVGTTVAISLSDANCVRRNLATLRNLVEKNLVQVILANDREIAALFEVATAEEAFAVILRDLYQTCVVTLGDKGAAIVHGFGDGDDHSTDTHVRRIPAKPVGKIVDLVGAGDSFAAGYLLGSVRWDDDVRAASLGAACAANVISGSGARPAIPFLQDAEIARCIAPTPRTTATAVAALLAFDEAAGRYVAAHRETDAPDRRAWMAVLDQSDVIGTMSDDHLTAYMAAFRLYARGLDDPRYPNWRDHQTMCVIARRAAFKHHVADRLPETFTFY